MLYTAAMIAELAKVPVASVRAWQRRGWLAPVEVEHGLARFDHVQNARRPAGRKGPVDRRCDERRVYFWVTPIPLPKK